MHSTHAIGGYFELELRHYSNFIHKNAVFLNSGRNAFAYILKAQSVKKIHLPAYVCPAVVQPLRQLHVDYSFYDINEDLEPEQKLSIRSDEYLLFVNYFGLKDTVVRKLTDKFRNIIIDNSQAFFCLPHNGRPTFYSPRKFFGVPDGGLAYVHSKDGFNVDNPPEEISFERCAHLLKRIELGACDGFADYKSNERKFEKRTIAGMSRLTKKLLFNIDFEWVRDKRDENFHELHSALKKSNKLSHIIESDAFTGPMMYPYLSNHRDLRSRLRHHRIYTPTYWPEISEMFDTSNTFALYLAENLIPLPIDQRYGRYDMHRIISIVEQCNG